MFGSSESSSSQSQASSAINSSGWVVGGGSASGGDLNSGAMFGGLKWYAWASMGAVALAFVYYKRKNKRG